MLAAATFRAGAAPDFGPNVAIFDPSMSKQAIQEQLDSVFRTQERSQFGPGRYALLFKPGTYSLDANIGFYTQIAGLGTTPDAVKIEGYVRAEADWSGDNGTVNFWRDAENMMVDPPAPDHRDRWAVSQAAPFRRMHIHGNLQLDPRGHGWSSGGFMADCMVDGNASSGSQQQYVTRNCELGSWSGSVWNMVFVGVQGGPEQHFPNPSHTVVDQAPMIREKPFLCVDQAGNYQVFVPALRTNAAGTSWGKQAEAGNYLPISQFFIVKPGATAAQMNAALAQGLNLLITPGVYHLDQTIMVNRPNTVILGLGLATLELDKGIYGMRVADVDGVKIAGLLFDAGAVSSPIMLQIGPAGSKANHAANPTSLHDVFTRVGGAGVGKVGASVVVNSNNVIIDHTWLWRADHGDGVGWGENTADYGLVVLGNDVTIYGLFVEHFQKYNVVWAGNGGRTYMFQNELPYDVPSQMTWANGAHQGYAAYKVMDNVTTHEAWGLGSYCYFNVNPSMVVDHSFEAPDKPGIKFHDLLTVSLNSRGTIAHIINSAGDAAGGRGTHPQYLASYPEGQ